MYVHLTVLQLYMMAGMIRMRPSLRVVGVVEGEEQEHREKLDGLL